MLLTLVLLCGFIHINSPLVWYYTFPLLPGYVPLISHMFTCLFFHLMNLLIFWCHNQLKPESIFNLRHFNWASPGRLRFSNAFQRRSLQCFYYSVTDYISYVIVFFVFVEVWHKSSAEMISFEHNMFTFFLHFLTSTHTLELNDTVLRQTDWIWHAFALIRHCDFAQGFEFGADKRKL